MNNEIKYEAEVLNRFIIFGFDGHIAPGGGGDIVDSFNSVEEAFECLSKDNGYSRYDILDCDKRQFVSYERNIIEE